MSMLIKKITYSVTWAAAILPRQCSSVFSLRNGLLACLAWLFALSLTFSCDKLPRNGKLDGHWQLMERDGSSVQAEHILGHPARPPAVTVVYKVSHHQSEVLWWCCGAFLSSRRQLDHHKRLFDESREPTRHPH